MSENNQNQSNQSKNSKQRLGRGLGSLLGGSNSQGGNFDESSNPTANAVAKITGAPIESLQSRPVPVSQPIPPSNSNVNANANSAAKAVSPSVAPTESPANASTSDLKIGLNPDPKSEPALDTDAVNTTLNPTVTVSAPIVNSAAKTDAKPDSKTEPAPAIPDNARIWTVPVEKLVANTQQPRQVFEDTALKELSASIREKGILQPITARRLSEHEFEIIAGERRWRAAQMAGLKEVPVILRTVTEQDSLELAILENIQRADLNPIEESEAYDHLMKTYGLTQAQVADRLGKERSSVANALRLMALPPEVKLMIGGGELSSGHAKVLLGLESMADQISLAKEVIREKLSVRALEKKVAEKKTMGAGATSASRPAMGLDVSAKLVEALAGELQKLIGTRVVIDYADRRGKLSVYFHSDEQLTEVVERMRKGWAKSSAIQGSPGTASSRNS